MRNAFRIGLTAAVTVGASLATGAAAQATPAGPDVTSKVIAQTTVNGEDYILREVTVPPGQATGWHYHDGTLYGLVKQGTLSHFDATCQSDGVYETGDTLIETSGSDHVHIGRNLGTEPLVLEVLYVLPHGAPSSEDAPNPGCDFE